MFNQNYHQLFKIIDKIVKKPNKLKKFTHDNKEEIAKVLVHCRYYCYCNGNNPEENNLRHCVHYAFYSGFNLYLTNTIKKPKFFTKFFNSIFNLLRLNDKINYCKNNIETKWYLIEEILEYMANLKIEQITRFLQDTSDIFETESKLMAKTTESTMFFGYQLAKYITRQ